jgi:hypothetical protein
MLKQTDMSIRQQGLVKAHLSGGVAPTVAKGNRPQVGAWPISPRWQGSYVRNRRSRSAATRERPVPCCLWSDRAHCGVDERRRAMGLMGC